MEKIVLFGTAEGSKLFYYSLSNDPAYEVVAFTVDKQYITGDLFCGLPVVAFEDVATLYPPSEFKMFIAILANDMNRLRQKKYTDAKDMGYTLISYIHPQAFVAPEVTIGDNCFISEGVILRPELVIGNDVIIMAGVFIGHSTIIHDHSYLASRAVVMGAVTIESYCSIGPNATIMEDIIIAKECLIGGGCVILKNTKEKEVYRANPATLLPLTSDQLSKLVYRRRR
jgi:sugar O-acyltransferase (sialic acid O-acetyltransferase NeuD family)